jgi:predicted HicB family RNase H-like nuclease
MNAATEYFVMIRPLTIDGEDLFEARVRELPDIVEFADTAADAHELALDSIVTTAKLFAEMGRNMPAPIVDEEEFSGRLTLRVPKSLHRELYQLSSGDGISLNQYIVSALTFYVGRAHGIHESSKHQVPPSFVRHSEDRFFVELGSLKLGPAAYLAKDDASRFAFEHGEVLSIPPPSSKWQ